MKHKNGYHTVMVRSQCAVHILYSKISTDLGLLKIRHSHRFVAVVIQISIPMDYKLAILILREIDSKFSISPQRRGSSSLRPLRNKSTKYDGDANLTIYTISLIISCCYCVYFVINRVLFYRMFSILPLYCPCASRDV